MGKLYDSIKPAHKEFIEKQHMFFVATAPLSANGIVNLSPKGLDCFRVLAENKVAYMDLISSGNETSAHTLENGRITIMFCSFEGAPNILSSLTSLQTLNFVADVRLGRCSEKNCTPLLVFSSTNHLH